MNKQRSPIQMNNKEKLRCLTCRNGTPSTTANPNDILKSFGSVGTYAWAACRMAAWNMPSARCDRSNCPPMEMRFHMRVVH